jgi:uncharacterized membrane protein YqaE (UPF0057 family)
MIKEKIKNNKKEFPKNPYEDFKNSFKETKSSIKENFTMLNTIKDIGKTFAMIGKGLGTIFKMLYWFFKIFMFFLKEVINPVNLFKDLYNGATSIPIMIINAFVRIIVSICRWLIDKVFSPIMNKIFGWDMSNKNDESVNNNEKKCYKAEEGTVPLSILISTIILPPMGVFMRFGLNRWLDILITGGLSILYYFPGLIYGLILIYT